MTLLYIKRYSIDYVELHPDWLFIYGDNLQGKGNAGQATIRPARNAVGIPTKRAPAMVPEAFFTNADYAVWHRFVEPIFRKLTEFSVTGRTIIWPLDGIGTGLAQLEQRAPKIWGALEDFRMALE